LQSRIVLRGSVLAAAMVAIPVAMVVAAPPAAAADLTTFCDGNLDGNTFTLTANCATTEPLTVPDGVTVDGAGPGAPPSGYTISASDTGEPQWNGGIVTNEAAGGSMNIRNLIVTGPPGGFQLCTEANNVLYGIFFNDASGTVDNVTVDNIFQFQNGAFGSCQTGRAIRADGLTGARTVTITSTTVVDYQKSGFEARGSMTMDLTGSTAGPPRPLEGLISQNGVSFVNTTTGTVENNTIHGSSDQAPGPGGFANGTAMLLSNADNLMVNDNTFVGSGTDIGVAVSAGSTGNTISFNAVTRTASENPENTDPTGIGINVDPDSSATLICNTFDGWNQNIAGAIQIACTPLPDGAECELYSAGAPTVEGTGTEPFTWSVESGELPPGLSLAPNGDIAGTPPDNSEGTYEFTLRVTTANNLTATSDQEITIAPGCETATPTPTTPTPTTPATETTPPTPTPTAPTPTQPPSVGPTGGAQPPAVPTGVAAGLPGSDAPISASGAPDWQLPMMLVGLTLLAAGAVLAAILGRRRGARRH
ncbi:MAG: putative Ig domain-containing protein, partial [Nocardioidaceae bacterium]